MATKATELVEIRPVEMAVAEIKIVGETPLIVHAWSAKAKREILEKELGVTKTKSRDPKNPIEDFCASMYWLTPMPDKFDEKTVGEALQGARFGFPVGGIKQAAISAAYRQGWVKDKMSLRGTFFIEPDVDFYYGGDLEIDYGRKAITIVPNQLKSEQMVEIFSDTPVMREDMVRVGMGSADIRYRGEFDHWSAKLKVKYDKNGKFSLEQILNVINAGGAFCGIGEWRPEKDGQYGMYHVEA